MATTFKQEMPPKGGYGSINYKRAIPKRGPSGYMLLSGVTAMVMGGMLIFAASNRHRRWLQLETKEARVAIHPLIEAEKDRDELKLLKFNREQEAIIMKDVPGWVVGASPFHTTRWITPSVNDLYYLDDDVKYHKIHGFQLFV